MDNAELRQKHTPVELCRNNPHAKPFWVVGDTVLHHQGPSDFSLFTIRYEESSRLDLNSVHSKKYKVDILQTVRWILILSTFSREFSQPLIRMLQTKARESTVTWYH